MRVEITIAMYVQGDQHTHPWELEDVLAVVRQLDAINLEIVNVRKAMHPSIGIVGRARNRTEGE
ncbi:hypothetical protein H4W33_006467 [Kibdelosporangium phytohabitans]|uniref:Uncharacterized protein n=1 Tax=Kibdelosporangium phytohabitans TaxID=860235 RepID=A0A0N9HJS1_9PSEU|nr:hypothetical protein AOZ06_04760 [Kibdelosporangium phytohabitans]MBE1467455.1 hypothetical protein [Kibdelosporangium phytohabitans]